MVLCSVVLCSMVLCSMVLCSMVLCSMMLGADLHLKLLDSVVSSNNLLADCAAECNIAHHRSVAVMGMQYKIRIK